MMIEIRTARPLSIPRLFMACYDQDAMHPEGLELFDQNGNGRGFVDPKYAGERPVLEDLWVMQDRFATSAARTVTRHRHLRTTVCSRSPSPNCGHISKPRPVSPSGRSISRAVKPS